MAAIRRRQEYTGVGGATPAQEDDFLNAVEAKSPEEQTPEQRIAYRADGRYYQLLTYRGTEKQKALIDFAAEKEGLSIQKLLESILMPELEKRHGREFDAQ